MPKEQTEICTLRVPTSVGLSKNTEWLLNLNNYRNAHYQVLNKAKVNFKNLVTRNIQQLPTFKKIESIEYKLYRDSKRHCDVANVCSIVDKFFCDALVEAGKLPDDNYHYLKNVSYQWGGVLPTANEKSFVEITLKGIIEMKLNTFTKMDITLDSSEVVEAVKAYIVKTISVQNPDLAKNLNTDDITIRTEEKGIVTAELIINSNKGSNTTESNSDSSIRSVSKHGGVQDLQHQSAEPEEVKAPETAEKVEETATTAEEPAPATEPEVKAEPEQKPARKNIFAKRTTTSAEQKAEATDTNPSDSGARESEVSNPDTDGSVAEVTASNVGASIFGRRRAS